MRTTAAPPPLWVDRPADNTPALVFAVALLCALILHLSVLLSVDFRLPETDEQARRTRPLEVMVLRSAAPTDEKPEDPDAYAQVDRVGGGTAQTPEPDPEPRLPAEPMEPPPEPASQTTESPPPPAPKAAQPNEPPPLETLTATIEPRAQAPESPPMRPEPPPDPQSEPEPAEPPRVSAAEILASRNLEIARLAATIEEKGSAYANRPRRKAISASTREYKYASYLDGWRRKVERIGNLNYPEEAKTRKLYGSLILHVAVRSDGSVEDIRVLRSSGFDVLDEAAVRIVELAAPFAPFPPEIRAEADVLDITRTWQFLSSNRLGWKN